MFERRKAEAGAFAVVAVQLGVEDVHDPRADFRMKGMVLGRDRWRQARAQRRDARHDRIGHHIAGQDRLALAERFAAHLGAEKHVVDDGQIRRLTHQFGADVGSIVGRAADQDALQHQAEAIERGGHVPVIDRFMFAPPCRAAGRRRPGHEFGAGGFNFLPVAEIAHYTDGMSAGHELARRRDEGGNRAAAFEGRKQV